MVRWCDDARWCGAVPTLCLTSDEDMVVPARGVRAYAAALSKAHPGRDVRVSSLKGSHCQLFTGDRERYADAISQLVEVIRPHAHDATAAHAAPPRRTSRRGGHSRSRALA
jgi:dienelactone hydrolase